MIINYNTSIIQEVKQKIDKAYYIDLETKESKEFKLFDKNRYLVEILAENEEFYFVRTGYEMGAEYTTWAGTKQQDIEKRKLWINKERRLLEFKTVNI